MLKHLLFIWLYLLLLPELTVCYSNDTTHNEIPCKITKAEALFKQLFGGFLPTPPNNTELESEFKRASAKFRGIFPGTLWCGAGNKAKKEEELGYFETTDACCRNHDNCVSKIFAGKKYQGLRNVGLFTRSHCLCDDEFHKCLKKADSTIASSIGKTYFNILRPQCFKLDYPASCKLNELSFYGIRCLEYEEDKTKDTIWQWRDAKIFSSKKKNENKNYPDYSEIP